ncbi:MAG: TPM domain-containing protein [Betaproteobacteria bacterium]|nr:TPM domain-containing protein [Betaproteobacteria bacterium]
MELGRFWRHIAMTPWKAAQAFPESALEAIGRRVGEHEKRHRGEVRFVVEAELTTAQLWSNLTSRARAIEVFSGLRVWDTEENTGVLVYVLLADHKVEIVADRGVGARVSPAEWQGICRAMQESFRAGRFEEGALEGVTAISLKLEEHFPAREANENELPDRPLMI